MIISVNWIRELLPNMAWNSTAVADQLTFAGLEVEHVVDQAARLKGFVVGHVLDKHPHPKADKLSVCTVDVGRDAPATIVCGAPNVAAGQRVPVALPGCRLPDADFTIAERPLRGVVSQGMICSQAELGMGEEADGIWVLDQGLTPGQDLAEALGQNDILFDIAITPNRADALSHIGLAREIALLTHPAQPHTVTIATVEYQPDTSVAAVEVRIEAPDLCHRFLALPINGITLGPSPEWMQRRLLACGMRPRNVIVDVTNYVMLETGQPLHAYDARSVTDRTFVARKAGADAPFTTLDGTTRKVDKNMLMICDTHQALGVAGVMGGKNSEVAPDTVDIILESAWFLPSSIRRTAKVLDIQSDASYRFERGIDPLVAKTAILRAAQLLAELAGGTRGVLTDEIAVPYAAPTFTVRFDRVRAVLGTYVENKTIADICKSMHCNVLEETSEILLLRPPSWRVDISTEIDIVEEVMRVVGLNAIPVPNQIQLPVFPEALPSNLRRSKVSGEIVQVLIRQGFSDCVTTSQSNPSMVAFTGVDGVRVANPLGVDGSMMRTSLIPGLLEAAAWNIRHGSQEIRLAEEGRIFVKDSQNSLGVREERRVAFVLSGELPTTWQQPKRVMDFYDAAGLLEALCLAIGTCQPTVVPDTTAPALWSQNVGIIHIGTEVIGRIGQVSEDVVRGLGMEQSVYALEIDPDLLHIIPARYAVPSSYPVVERDMALVVPSSILAGTLVQAVENTKPDILSAIHIFDVFTDERYLGEGKKSLGLRLTFMRSDRTLVDQEVDAAVHSVLSTVERSCGAVLRGAVL